MVFIYFSDFVCGSLGRGIRGIVELMVFSDFFGTVFTCCFLRFDVSRGVELNSVFLDALFVVCGFILLSH